MGGSVLAPTAGERTEHLPSYITVPSAASSAFLRSFVLCAQDAAAAISSSSSSSRHGTGRAAGHGPAHRTRLVGGEEQRKGLAQGELALRVEHLVHGRHDCTMRDEQQRQQLQQSGPAWHGTEARLSGLCGRGNQSKRPQWQQQRQQGQAV